MSQTTINSSGISTTGGVTAYGYPTGTGSVTASSINAGSITFNTISSATSIQLSGPRPTIQIDEGEIDLKELLHLMREMKERLCILTANLQNHAEYPALQSVYDQYKVVEKLVAIDRDQ